ncbi:unnamed protein product, partial [Rotaria sp. Silwood1]
MTDVCADLAKIVRSYRRHKTLSTLNLKWNKIGDQGGCDLAEAVLANEFVISLKSFGNTTISFELSIDPIGYLNPQELTAAIRNPVSLLTRAYPRISIDNNKDYFRLPIDLQKTILFTKYLFHNYIYRMALSNRLKHAFKYLFKIIREFDSKINSKISNEILLQEYRIIENYIHTLPCGCADHMKDSVKLGTTPAVHPNLYELL